MIETIEFKNKKYPYFQAQGNAAQFALPFAKWLCRGVGYDIGDNIVTGKQIGRAHV